MNDGQLWSRQRFLCLGAFLVGNLLVVACGSSEPSSSSSTGSTQPTEPVPRAGKIIGLIEGQGDVGTNEVIGTATDGTVAIIPAEDIGLVWDVWGLVPSERQMATASPIISRDDIPNAILAEVNENGEFSADPDDGEYVACLMWSGDGPWGFRGCGPMTVDGPATWGILTGEGGVDVFERSS